MSIEQLLNERQKTHGHFDDHARCTQDLKAVLHTHLARRNKACAPPLRATQIESVEMILHKIGRIVAGDPDYQDHWDDIAGYAKIANYKAP